MKDLINKLKKYEIKIRKVVQTRMHGDYHSVFKGSGLEYNDVRSYQYGDDVRTIDWNVTAKGHGTYVKTFKEEKEQNVLFILDVSASQEIGSSHQKLEIAKEICGVLTLSAIKESANVGLICFSNQKELFIKPDKGIGHAYHIIFNLFKLQSKSSFTDINKSIRFALGVLKRKNVVIFISDFIDENYEKNLSSLAQKHDLVVIHINDPRELHFPKLGIIPLFDKESRKTIWVNSSSKKFREYITLHTQNNKQKIEALCKKYKASYLWVNSEEEYVTKLIRLFKVRSK